MALQGCYCHHIKLPDQPRTLHSFSFSSSISVHKLSKNERPASGNDRFPRFPVEMRQTESPPSKKYSSNGRAVKMVPADELVKRKKTVSPNKLETVNGVSLVKRDRTPALTKRMESGTSKDELPPLEDLKVLPSDEGFSWASENYNSWQRSIDVWSFVISFRIRVLLDNAKWAYLGGFTEEKQVGRKNFFSYQNIVFPLFYNTQTLVLMFLFCLVFNWSSFCFCLCYAHSGFYFI